MIVRFKLRDEQYCNGCPCLNMDGGSADCNLSYFMEDGYGYPRLTDDFVFINSSDPDIMKERGCIRPGRCIQEHAGDE